MDETVREILQAIVDYTNDEYGDNETIYDIKDRSHVGVMYCTFDEWEDEECTVLKCEHDVQWVVDLEKKPFEMRLYLDDLMETSPIKVLYFTPEEMLKEAKSFYWDDLYYEACHYGRLALENAKGENADDVERILQ